MKFGQINAVFVGCLAGLLIYDAFDHRNPAERAAGIVTVWLAFGLSHWLANRRA